MPAIVMVHGAFCGAWTFDRFRVPFEAAGYEVIAPDLRGHAPDERASAVVGVSMADYAADIAAICAALPEPPVLLGHSMGGLVAQLAARRAPVEAVVLLAPSAPWGVAGSSLEEAVTAFGVQVMGSFSSGALEPDRSLMRLYSLDRMPEAEREAAIARLGRESGLAVRETLNWWLDPFMTTSVGAGPLGVPALVITGQRDVVHAPATARAIATRIGATFQIVPGMSHWLVGEPGWDAVADAALTWLADEVRAAAA
jgi:pimeloyl-ACP methyl ester carboxylesterase